MRCHVSLLPVWDPAVGEDSEEIPRGPISPRLYKVWLDGLRFISKIFFGLGYILKIFPELIQRTLYGIPLCLCVRDFPDAFPGAQGIQ